MWLPVIKHRYLHSGDLNSDSTSLQSNEYLIQWALERVVFKGVNIFLSSSFSSAPVNYGRDLLF